MAALSVHSLSGGIYASSPSRAHMAPISARSRLLADTPPAMATRFMPVSCAASRVRSTSASTTARRYDAAKSARSMATPCCASLWLRLMAAVLMPEKEKFMLPFTRGLGKV